mmetsp:Transcript_29878/g.55874  ORF Transcript_29878/g.55874 Transcript_29878/m.55874 type:complete len:80 (-) Transcript_29878:210-449(-)
MNAVTSEGNIYGKIDETTQGGMEPEDLAKQIFSVVEAKTSEIVVAPPKVRLGIMLRNILPSVVFKSMAKRAAAEQGGGD